MGLIDKLLFWRSDTVEFDADIHGCFTLPGAEIGGSVGETTSAGHGDDAPAAVDGPETG